MNEQHLNDPRGAVKDVLCHSPGENRSQGRLGPAPPLCCPGAGPGGPPLGGQAAVSYLPTEEPPTGESLRWRAPHCHLKLQLSMTLLWWVESSRLCRVSARQTSGVPNKCLKKNLNHTPTLRLLPLPISSVLHSISFPLFIQGPICWPQHQCDPSFSVSYHKAGRVGSPGGL